MTSLLTIDPGEQTGWALWWKGKMNACGLGGLRLNILVYVDQAYIECPKIYPHTKARPNDLIKLARLVGRYEQFCEDLGAEVQVISPSDWKGQLSKDVSNARTWTTLNESERQIFTRNCGDLSPSKKHNVLDAIGIGLWVLKRK